MDRKPYALALGIPSLIFAANLSASPVYTTTVQTSAYTVSSADLLEGLTPVYTTANDLDSSTSGGLTCITDGVAPSSASTIVPVGDGTGGYDSGYSTLIYNLSSSSNLSALNFYFYWSDNGRDNPPVMTISTDDSTTSDPNDSGWSVLESYPGSTNPDGDDYSEVSFTDSDGGILASGVESIEITFGAAENGWVGLGEIDAIAATPEPAPLACLGIAGAGILLLRRSRRPVGQ